MDFHPFILDHSNESLDAAAVLADCLIIPCRTGGSSAGTDEGDNVSQKGEAIRQTFAALVGRSQFTRFNCFRTWHMADPEDDDTSRPLKIDLGYVISRENGLPIMTQ